MLFALLPLLASAALSLPGPVADILGPRASPDPKVRQYITPQRIVWQAGTIENSEALFREFNGVMWDVVDGAVFYTGSSVLLDYGVEMVGGVQIAFSDTNGTEQTIRVRFGESATEAMAEKGDRLATNFNAVRDTFYNISDTGTVELGNTGFRFIRLDVVKPDAKVTLQAIRAIFTYRERSYLGSFKSNDARLNKIWLTGAYTVHLATQDYQWDGIKRDRLVWIGDLEVETSTTVAAFGDVSVIQASADQIRDVTPPTEWMNTISSYSLWWIRVQHDLYMYTGDLQYLQEQKTYLEDLMANLCSKIDNDGAQQLDGWRFIDWPSSDDDFAVNAGLQAMMVIAFDQASYLLDVLHSHESKQEVDKWLGKLRSYIPENPNNNKEAAALMALAGLADAEEVNEDILKVGGVSGIGTFLGYQVLQAKSLAGDVQGGLDLLRNFWGVMLDYGATTWWEEFDLAWVVNASKISELPQEGQVDLHGDRGAYCYEGFKKSLCHGWSSGPTPWLTRSVLGINIVEPGCRVLRISPSLGDLEFVEGSFPTPRGVLRLRHEKRGDQVVTSLLQVPRGVRIENLHELSLVR